MQSVVVLTVVGEDRPGLVRRIAAAVRAVDGNWERSQLARLAGTFAGIVEVTVPAERHDDLLARLRDLDGLLEVGTRTSNAATPSAAGERFTLEIVGDDHPGIVEDVTATLERSGATIEDMTTSRRDAPMSGEAIFEATAVVRLSKNADVGTLEAALEAIAGDLMIDITLGDASQD